MLNQNLFKGQDLITVSDPVEENHSDDITAWPNYLGNPHKPG